MSFESPNKENVSGTPSLAALGSPKLDEYSPSTKRVLKPISPNKAANSHVGRLSFLQNDTIDDHFEHLHSSQHDIQQLLLILEAQTKQTGMELGQLVDRLKNNNAHLNKLLQSIAAYSEEVVTEGNATKNDITNIVARLDAFNRHLESLNAKNSTSDADAFRSLEKGLLDLSRQLGDILNKSRLYNESIRDDILQNSRASKSDDLKSILSAELSTAAVVQNKLHGEVLAQLESLKPHMTEGILSKEDLIAELERARSVTSQEHIKLMDVLQSAHEANELSRIADIIARNHSQVLEKHNDASKEFSTIKERLPSDSIRQIVDPIIAELKAVSLDQKSLRLLEDILSILGNERRSHELEQQFQEKSISHLRNIDEKVDLGHQELLAKLNSNIQHNSTDGTDELGLLRTQIANQLMIINDLKHYYEDQERSGQLESKVNILEKRYESLCNAYQQKFDEFQDLERKFAQLNSNLSDEGTMSISSDTNPALKMTKIRKLHSYKMGELEESGRVEIQKKRILSTPLQYGVGQTTPGPSNDDAIDELQ